MEESKKYDFEDSLQMKILSLLCQDYTWAISSGFEIVQPEYFDDGYLQKLFKWSQHYIENYRKPVTKQVLSDYAEKAQSKFGFSLAEKQIYDNYIDNIFEPLNESGYDIDYIKDRALEFAKREKFRIALQKTAKLLDQDPTAYEQAIPLMQNALSVGAGLDMGMELRDVIGDFQAILGQRYDTKKMVTTGNKELDEAIGGGWINGTLSIIGAPSGGGKSRALANFAVEALKQGKNVVFVTFELHEDETMANIISNITKMSWWEMMQPEFEGQYFDTAASFIGKYDGRLKVKFYLNRTVTVQTVYAYLMRLRSVQNFHPDIIIVDYIDLLLPQIKINGRVENDYNMLGDVCVDLINLANQFDCPVLSASQVGKFSWDLKGDEVITMASVADSAKKIHNAHNFITINQNPMEKETGRARLFTAKARTGTTGKTLYNRYDLKTCTIESIPQYDPKDNPTGAGYSAKTNNAK